MSMMIQSESDVTIVVIQLCLHSILAEVINGHRNEEIRFVRLLFFYIVLLVLMIIAAVFLSIVNRVE